LRPQDDGSGNSDFGDFGVNGRGNSSAIGVTTVDRLWTHQFQVQEKDRHPANEHMRSEIHSVVLL
jgi:hypothetical protein